MRSYNLPPIPNNQQQPPFSLSRLLQLQQPQVRPQVQQPQPQPQPQSPSGGGFRNWITRPEIAQGFIGAGRGIANSGYGGDMSAGIYGFNDAMQKQKQLDFDRKQQEFDNKIKSQNTYSSYARALKGNNLPAPLQIAEAYEKARLAGDTNKMNQIATFSKVYEKNTQLDSMGNLAPIPGAPRAIGQLAGAKKGAEQEAKNISDLEYAQPLSREKDLGKVDADRQANLTKAQSSLKDFEIKSNIVTNNIDKANELIDKGFATGYASYLSGAPNTDAGELRNVLDTIKANVGFDNLQKMRDNSPTGGALGQVSEMENRLLQAISGSLDPKQGKLLKQNLSVIKELYPQVLKEKKRAFNQDYGKFLPKGSGIGQIGGISKKVNAPIEANIPQPAATPPEAAAPRRRVYNPETGQFQ